ncbi:MAG: hypothetical protein ACXQTR_01900 [Candidatus Methanospirareceae archaeon]
MNNDQRRPIERYIGEYKRFIEVCKENPELRDISSIELAILHHGYATGGQQNA